MSIGFTPSFSRQFITSLGLTWTPIVVTAVLWWGMYGRNTPWVAQHSIRAHPHTHICLQPGVINLSQSTFGMFLRNERKHIHSEKTLCGQCSATMDGGQHILFFFFSYWSRALGLYHTINRFVSLHLGQIFTLVHTTLWVKLQLMFKIAIRCAFILRIDGLNATMLDSYVTDCLTVPMLTQHNILYI